VDASSAICGLLSTCYAAGTFSGCEAHVNGDLEDAGAGDRDGWLQALSAQGCLDSCSTARDCLDTAPVCAKRGTGCTQAEECCGFTSGSGDCDTRAHRCCVPQGQRCSLDSDCCDSAGVCDNVDGGTGTCGGTICRGAGVACQLDRQCCSETCLSTGCAAKTCKVDHFDCKSAGECCSGFCDPGGHCAEPVCLGEGQPCTSAKDCCQAPGHALVCYMLGTEGFCSPGMCTPQQVGCMSDDQCCTGSCDPTYHVCAAPCVVTGDACQRGAECCTGTCDAGTCAGCSTASCDAGADCCSGTCVAGTCTAPCGQTTCTGHDVCQVGAALSSKGCGDPTLDACITAICNTDAYCCCTAWDSFCAGEALAAHAKLGSPCSTTACNPVPVP
jgi:hypothetical protein